MRQGSQVYNSHSKLPQSTRLLICRPFIAFKLVNYFVWVLSVLESAAQRGRAGALSHRPGYVYEHRLVASEMLGRFRSCRRFCGEPARVGAARKIRLSSHKRARPSCSPSPGSRSRPSIRSRSSRSRSLPSPRRATVQHEAPSIPANKKHSLLSPRLSVAQTSHSTLFIHSV